MITLVPYNPLWSKLFEEEKIRLQKVLGDIAIHIEHIGSTAIPEIYSKPIIDILIGVKDLNQFSADHIKKIESLGYIYNSAFEAELPYRRFFQKSDENHNRTHHIHLVNYPSAWWQRHILFRDYLRQHPDDAREYEAQKLALAKQFSDTLDYAKAKEDFCCLINKNAYFDFTVHQPFATTQRLNGYIPQLSCFDIYRSMFQDQDFIRCYGVTLSDEYLKKILVRDANYWDQYRFGSLVWFDKETQEFVGEGGLNHTVVEGNEDIEVTYSLSKKYWGKGLAAEIGQYAIDYAFNSLNLDHVVCFTMPTNNQSLRVMEKLGFQYEKDFTYSGLPHKLYRLMNAKIMPYPA
jgi:GrpB-like predicted nucleotidyltransferase (UPF0157 family)/GNAT superfamily N-acetyltransferase